VTYSIYSSKKEPVNVSLQVIYLGESGWVNLTNQALNSDDYYLNSTIDISLVMATLGITADYNSPYTLNLNATNYVTHLYADTQGNFRLRDSTYDLVILFFPLIILILFSILAFWKQSKIILTATITTAILYATMLATSFAGTIDTWYVVLLIVYALALSTMFFFWKKGTKK
jgi:general stress protein CsbA